MSPGRISVISSQDINCANETEQVILTKSKLELKYVRKALCILIFGIIGLSVLFNIPWTTIPRTDSIIYQSYWMEILFPIAINTLLLVGVRFQQLTTWIKEEELMTIWIYMKMYFLQLAISDVLYISCYVIWSIHLQYNHPMPKLLFVALPGWILFMTGLWFILPSHLISNQDFRQKLIYYMAYQLWHLISVILREILSYLFINIPINFQFLVPFMVAGCRELEKLVRTKLLTKMMGAPDEAATVLLVIHTSSAYALFIAIRLVGASFSTTCCAVAIDFVLHLKLTLQIIKECRRVNGAETENRNTQCGMKFTKLIIAELIEGLTPIIYLICVVMAYYGPNAHLFSNIGNSYWSETIDDIGPLCVTMIILFSVDLFSILINGFFFWKTLNVNMVPEFCRIVSKYWFFMSINLACSMALYFISTDINCGMDQSRSFEWITKEGWINLVNRSTELTREEKSKLIAQNI